MDTFPDDLTPPLPFTQDGAPRRVGVEMEFLGPSARQAAEALARDIGGTADEEDAHAYKVRASRFGDISIDLDLRYVHPQRHPGLGYGLGRGRGVRLTPGGAAWFGTLVSPIVPREMITAPLPLARLPELDDAVESLRRAGARGQGRVFFDALSMHFNVEPPRLDAETVTSFLKAFLLLEGRFRREVSRGENRLAGVLPDAYPEAYMRRVLAPDYWPDLTTLAADYLAANPSRKRALDLLPLFTFLDEAQVRAVLPREKIGPRPVFHYRLPLAFPGEAGWSILPDWRRWLAVERLAADRETLTAPARA
ncbi:amidoligase family protein [Salinarimonas soli]|uniref:Amidoligase enzyme n=1 Tax=Salinarimonas soli TaxID=1638099 RepID=A0A5B2VHT4_9HYPH|nr:amidoligase family protein [Salinarimonas soli]KAA2238050.1 hypothetical protein F0L46_07205 [Salinarimonas soli]